MGVTGERRTVGGKGCCSAIVDKARRGWGSTKRKYQCTQ